MRQIKIRYHNAIRLLLFCSILTVNVVALVPVPIPIRTRVRRTTTQTARFINKSHDYNQSKSHVLHCNPEKIIDDVVDIDDIDDIAGIDIDADINPTKRQLDVFVLTFPQLYPLEVPTATEAIDTVETIETIESVEATLEDTKADVTATAKDNKTNIKTKNVMKLLKQWKYYVLGDGGVYFDQRPNTLLKLNQHITQYIQKGLLLLKDNQGDDNDGREIPEKMDIECAVISTCKRFEILISIETTTKTSATKTLSTSITDQNDNKKLKDEIKNIITSYLTKQILSQRRSIRIIQRFVPFLLLPLDRPSRIKQIDINMDINIGAGVVSNAKLRNKYNTLKQSLESEIEFVDGVQDVTKRLLNLSAGLLDRPIFRPFSSRDAHVMSQIKRTAESSVRYSYECKNTNTNIFTRKSKDGRNNEYKYEYDEKELNSTKYTKIIFDSALQTGKAARSPKVVPILDQLRDESKGADGPPELSAKAAQSAQALAVSPMIISCVERFKALEYSDKIVTLRNDASRVCENYGIDLESNNGIFVRSMIHEPISDLRRGKSIDVDTILQNIEVEILKSLKKT